MNILEQNRDDYLARNRSPVRIIAIVVGIVVFHIVVITAVARWRGWMPTPGEGLITVAIFPDKPTTPPAQHPR